MDPKRRWQKIKSVFDAVQDLDAGERETFLNDACRNDAELRREVEKLLNSLENAESFMEQPAVREAASMFEEKKTLPADQAAGDLNHGKFVAGTVLANRYRIFGILGKGGMGEVFKAEDMKLNQVVALKVLPDKLEKNKAALERFHAEVRIARQVSHPNVCRVFDIGEADGRHFLSMEFIDGDDMSSLLRRIGRLPSDKAIEIARQLCFGLAAIHEAGILHRDLKPANVIIDSRGKARITDFGIAGIEEELTGGELWAGTPAYMSPEQTAGKEVSPKSDIYALGLVLYEMFTGKQTFQADTIGDLLQKQQTTAPTNPSEVLKQIDPIVEKTILQCLEKNPSERPKNALQVAMMLPGGNPLEAAIAAGETPSPEMVAAAPKKGALKPAVAVACLSAAVFLFAFIAFFAGTVKDHEWIPLEKSPEALAERADSIVKKLGYQNTPVDIDYGFAKNTGDYYSYAAVENAPQSWERMRSGQPAIIYFWRRTSPRYLEPLQNESASSDDPPNDVAGMTKVITDPRGRLLEFQAVPPQVKDKEAPFGEVDWTGLFAEAGLDIRNYRQTQSNWTPPVFADVALAWEGAHVDHADIPVRIEAAAFRGKPVYFQVVAPWDKPVRQEETFSPAAWRAGNIILILIYLGVAVAGIFLARRNVRQGRGDTRGAFKITLFVFLTSLAAGLLVADHIPDLTREQPLLFKIAGDALFHAVLLAVLYLALEPFVRRRWANLIISWNRLLAGDFGDPLVGRDILIGGMLGLSHTFIIYLGPLSAQWFGLTVAPNPSLNISFLQSFRHLLANFLTSPGNSIFLAFTLLLLLVLLVEIFRKQWLAIATLWTVYFLVLGLFFGGEHWLGWLWTGSIATLAVVCISRFGLLAMISFHTFFHLSFHDAITANVSSWYFGNTIFSAVVLLGMAVYGFHTSLAGQKIFEGNILPDIKS